MKAIEPPHTARTVALQVALIALAVAFASRHRQSAAEPAQPAPSPLPSAPAQPAAAEARPATLYLRTVQLPRSEPSPAPAPAPATVATPEPTPVAAESPARVAPHREEPRAAPRASEPRSTPAAAAPATSPRERAPAPSPGAGDRNPHEASPGLPLQILVPNTPAELASHLAASGGCLVISALHPNRAEPVAVLNLSGARASIAGYATANGWQGPRPCGGVPRTLDPHPLDQLLGGPLADVRARIAGSGAAPGQLAYQAVLSPAVLVRARAVLRSAFGDISDEALAQKARADGRRVRCFALRDGGYDCR